MCSVTTNAEGSKCALHTSSLCYTSASTTPTEASEYVLATWVKKKVATQ